MDLLFIMGFGLFVAAVVISSVARPAPQTPQIIYVRAELLDQAEGSGAGVGLALFLAAITLAIWLA